MAASSADLSIPKYAGSADDGPVEDWFNLFELHATAASWTERDMVAKFNDYVTGEAFKYYLTYIFQNDETWKRIKEEMITRFKEYHQDSSATYQTETFEFSRHNHKQSSRGNRVCGTWPHIRNLSTVVPCYNSPEYMKRIRTPSTNLQFPTVNRNSSPTETHGSHIPKRPNLPPAFRSAEKSPTSTSSLRCSAGVVTQPSHAFGSSSRTSSPPPGFATNASSVARNGPRMPRRATTSTVDGLMRRENAKPCDIPFVLADELQDLSATVPQKAMPAHSKAGQTMSSAITIIAEPPQDRSDMEAPFNTNLNYSSKKEPTASDDREKAYSHPAHCAEATKSACSLDEEHYSFPYETAELFTAETLTHTKSLWNSFQTVSHKRTQTNSEAPSTPSPMYCRVNDVPQASGKPSNTIPSLPCDPQSALPGIANLLNTSSCVENRSLPDGVSHQRLSQQSQLQQQQQHKQIDEREKPRQKHLQKQRRTQISSKAQLRNEEGCRTASFLHRRPLHDVSRLHRMGKWSTHLLHRRPGLHLGPKQSRHHHQKRRKRHKTTRSTPQERNRRPISFSRRARRLEAQVINRARQTVRRLRNASCRCNNVSQYYSPMTFLQVASSLLPMCWACLRRPQRSSQPRPPET